MDTGEVLGIIPLLHLGLMIWGLSLTGAFRFRSCRSLCMAKKLAFKDQCNLWTEEHIYRMIKLNSESTSRLGSHLDYRFDITTNRLNQIERKVDSLTRRVSAIEEDLKNLKDK